MGFFLLFDIDGTLLSTKGAGRTAMQMAMAEVLGVPNALEGEALGGRIDPDLIYGAIERWADLERGHPDASARYELIVSLYLEYLPQTLEASTGAATLPGVDETLAWLSSRERVLLGVGTGNMAAGAALKLRRCGIEHYFKVGGYGDDAHDRPGMLRAGWRRAAAHLPALQTPSEDNLLVIGDTVLDIAAARVAGFPVAAVATGRDSYDTLAGHKPDYLWRSMHEGLAWMRSRF